MNILILGGTLFLGRHLVDAALAQGHTVTLFNRGKTNSDLYPEVEKLRGDRTNVDDLQSLRDRHWDAVIDTCGYYPHLVQLSAQALADLVERYVFISSISVYGEPPTTPAIDENSPVAQLVNEDLTRYEKESYGNRKALSEQVIENELPGRTLNIRPGLIVGPYDPSDRFTYWPARLQRGGTVLAPGRPDTPVQVNGKLRGTVTVARDADQTTVEAAAREIESVTKHLNEGEIRKVIFIPAKTINFVVR